MGLSKFAGVAIATLFFCCISHNAAAALIDDFELGDGPAVLAESLLVAYDVDTGTLSIRGLQVDIDTGDGILSVDGSGIDLILSVDGSGLAGAGSFEVTGTQSDLGFESGTLLSGGIEDFGWPEFERGADGTDILQFVLVVDGGEAAGFFGARLAFLVSGVDFPGDWNYDWANAGDAFGIAANPIPLPAALWMMLPALLGLAGLRRRRG